MLSIIKGKLQVLSVSSISTLRVLSTPIFAATPSMGHWIGVKDFTDVRFVPSCFFCIHFLPLRTWF